MSRRLSGLEPSGWLGDLVTDYPTRPGKMLRPSICLATCRAFGGSVADGMPSAVALELLHNAFLIHDDIADDSLQRRGSPTLHEIAGVPLALNAGDALAMTALSVMSENRDIVGSRLAARLGREFDVMLRHTVEGQAIELGWRRDVVTDLGEEDYLDLIMRKTCWYTTVTPLRVGALVGSAGRADPEPMIRFGFYLGAAFQIRDDLLNLCGDEATYGKELLGDLYEGKRTLMLIHLLANASEAERDALVGGFLSRDRAGRTADDVAHVLELMHEHGSVDYATAFAEGIAAAAVDAFESAFSGLPHSDDRRFVEHLIGYMLERTA
jgi:geranylgeranyl diphosphate synthase, type II